MIVLHATWALSDRTGLLLWAEGEPGPGRETGKRGRKGAKARSAAPAHPFAVEGGRLRACWRAFGGDSDGDPSASVSLLLPSAGEGPVPSPERARAGDLSPDPPGELRLAEWTVPALAAPPAAALRWLARLPRADGDGVALPAPCRLGADLRFWAEAARLALELLARQRYLPAVVEQEEDHEARWRPLWDDARDAARLARLAAAMPPAARAAGADHSAEALLERFFQETIDAAVRAWGNGGAPPPHSTAGDAERWLSALIAPKAILAGRRALLARLARRVGEWTRGLLRPSAGGFRTCFQIEPPDVAEPDRQAGDAQWRLGFMLQAVDDLSLRVPAETVWDLRGDSLKLLNRRFENPQERLLEDLGRACRLFPPLAEGLRGARPAGTELSLDAAYQFLREAAPLLEESGYGVLAPSWWNRPTSRHSLRLRLRPARPSQGKTATRAGLGTGALVEFDWQAALGGEPLTREEFERLAALKTPLVNLRGQWVDLRPEDLQSVLQAWEAGQRAGATTLADALHVQAEAAAGGLAVETVEASGWIGALLGNGGAGKLATLPQPAAFQGTLRPYQAHGFSWLDFLRRCGLGACLADDMGLGKTPQCLAALLQRRAGAGGAVAAALLVCPPSVVENWRREAARFAPELRVLVHHGPARARGDAFMARAAESDLVVTTYALVHRDVETLRQVEWDALVHDEAQNVKNPETRQSRAVRALQAGWRAALSGTPVENRLRELWSIMQFLNPGYLGPEATFQRRFAVPIERYGDDARAATLRRLIEPFVLRRLKTDPAVIRDLPEKVEQKVFCPLTREQATLYEAVVRDMLQQVEEAEGMGRRGLVLSTLLRLKQVCNHPAHFLGDESPLPERSGKLNRLEELLDEALAVGDRALLFTQFAEMGRALQRHLRDRFGTEVLFLHGGVPRPKRDQMVARFQEADGPAVMVLSLKAGGVGLNLTRANQVFHFDRWWNPAVENQATDRAFRIGQRRNVLVHKFVCTGTVEERIDALIESKTALAERIVGTGEGRITELSTGELRELFTLRREAVEE